MIVGLTYDLRADYLAEGYGPEETAEFDRPDTIDAIENALRELGYRVDRVGHARNLMSRLSRGERWEFVFNIAEGMFGLGREALVPALLDAHQIPYTFSDPLVLALSLHKGMTKRVIRDLGIPTPQFAVVDSVEQIDAAGLSFPLFAKPVAEGTAKGIGADAKISSSGELHLVCRRLLEQFRQPVLVERFLPGREFTVGLLGTGDEARVVGTIEVLYRDGAEPHSYTFTNKENCEELCQYVVPTDAAARQAEQIALAAWRGLGCHDAGRIDLRCDERGEPQFMEVNPLAGLHPQHSDLPIICGKVGLAYVELIRGIMNSALNRAARAGPVTAGP